MSERLHDMLSREEIDSGWQGRLLAGVIYLEGRLLLRRWRPGAWVRDGMGREA